MSGPAGEVLTEANLARYYDARVRIVDDRGRPLVLPCDRSGGPSSPACHQALWSVLFAGGPQLPGNRPGTEVPGWQAVRT